MLLAVGLAGLLVGRDGILIPLLVTGPLVAATHAPATHTLAIALLAVLIGVGLGADDGLLGQTDHFIELMAVGTGGLIAYWVARNRDLLAGTGVRQGVELARERAARRRADALARAADLVGAQIDPAQTLQKVTELAVPDLAELCVVDVLEPDGTLRGAAAHSVEPGLAADVLEIRRIAPVDLATSHPTALAITTGTEQLVPALPEEKMREFALSDEHLALMRRARYTSGIAVPLLGREGTLGALSLLRLGEADGFDEEDLTLARDLAARAALALDAARLVADVHRSEQRFQAILDNMGEAVSAVAPDGSFSFANRAAAELLGVASPQAVVDSDVETVMDRWTIRDEEGRELGFDDLPLAAALAGRHPEPMLLHAVEQDTGRDMWLLNRSVPVLREDGSVELAVSVSEDVTAMKREESRQRFLAHAGELLGSSLELEETLQRIAWVAVPYLADWTRVDLLDERGLVAEVALAAADPDKIELLRETRAQGPPSREEKRGPYEAMRTGRTVVWANVRDEDIDAFARNERQAELMRRIATRSVLVVPMMAGATPIGAMQIATTDDSGRRLGETDVQLAEELARRATIAIENARLHEERSYIAATLQSSLLPPALPEIPGVELAVRFRATGEASDVGGDFYDAFRSGDGWMLAIGDVTGKGPEAAAITSLARHTMRTAAMYERDPARVLERLHEALRAEQRERRLCTALCARVEPGPSGVSVSLASGGHPAPYLLRPRGEPVAVGRHGLLLGAFPSATWEAERFELSPGDALVLFTDGVHDARGPGGERFGTERLEAVLRASAGRSADAIAGSIDQAVLRFQDGPQRDDVAVLVARALPGAE